MTPTFSQTGVQRRLTIFLAISIFAVPVVAGRATAQKGESANPAPSRPGLAVPEQPPFVAEKSPPALEDLAARLTRLLKADCPDAEVALHARELKVRFRTQKFMLHGRNKIGEFAERAHEEEGLRFRGFLLHVYFQEERPLRALVIPSDVQGPYWTTFVNDFAIGTGKDAGFASTGLSFNHGTDSKLLEKLKASLAADEKTAPATTSRKPAVENSRSNVEKKP